MPTFPVVSREEWGAIEPKYREPLTPPLEMVIFHCTGKKKCLDQASCVKIVQKLQKKHMKLGLPDILYNFLIGGDGVIYEGRGWETLATKYPNTKFDGKVMDVAYIGPYRIPEKMPPENMMETAVNLVNWGRIKKVLLEDCLRSDLDLKAGDSDEDDYESDGSIDTDDVVGEKELEELHLYAKPPTAKDIFGTQTDSDDGDVDSDDEEDDDSGDEIRNCGDKVDQSKVFNPEEDDIPFEM